MQFDEETKTSCCVLIDVDKLFEYVFVDKKHGFVR